MFQIFEILRTENSTIVVAEFDERLTPKGLAIELEVAVIGSRTLAWWLFEDGRIVTFPKIGTA